MLFLLSIACGPSVDAPSSSAIKVGDDGAEIDTSAAGISAFVASKAYKTWAAEANVHTATKTRPHGHVRVFFNQTSTVALKQNQSSLPVGTMVVKELYQNDGATLSGYAAMVKSSEKGWTWWEAFLPNLDKPAAYGIDLPGCKGCHSGPGNVDQVLSQVP